MDVLYVESSGLGNLLDQVEQFARLGKRFEYEQERMDALVGDHRPQWGKTYVFGVNEF